MTRRVLLLLCILGSSSSAFAQTWSTVSLATKDLAYSPLTQRLYATTPANNSVQEIDPFTGTLLRSLFVGSQPNKLAVSDTGSHLYVGIDGAGTVARINLATFTVDLRSSRSVLISQAPFWRTTSPSSRAIRTCWPSCGSPTTRARRAASRSSNQA